MPTLTAIILKKSVSLHSSQPEHPRGSLQATNNLEEDLKIAFIEVKIS